MGNILSGLKPEAIWKHFEEMCEIPHPSKHEQKMIEYIVNFAKAKNLEYEEDEVGNVVIRKPATPGMENRKGVILQGHLDMVPQANSDANHNFEKDPIKPRIDGEWVKGTGTTLGADNGIGVSTALAILEAKDLVHGPIEAIFTIDEETGMTGAFGLKPGFLKGDILMNLDSEDEGELFIGCAGGTNANVTFKYNKKPAPKKHLCFKIIVKGLKGGHSGCDIHLGRGNSNKLLFRFLKQAEKNFGLRLAAVEGGNLRNAIPREAYAVVLIPKDNVKAFDEALKQYDYIIKKEFAAVEPDLTIFAEKAKAPKNVLDKSTQKNLINAIFVCPNNVVRMSNDMPGLVETSTNLAIVKSNDKTKTVEVKCLLRSSVDSAKEALEQKMSALFELASADCTFDGQYPGWKPNPNSPILTVMLDVYEKMFGKKPEIKAIHAVLECGLIGGFFPNLDMISFGPTIKFPHSPDEQCNIETVNKFWNYIVDTLMNVPTK
ncbi:MAG: aminoacyl-histidine dipeptidase [Ignavibacteriae bacterium]|nr:aminoacyl-histidine dipeptidase [Ignavibacteriota bacterium]